MNSLGNNALGRRPSNSSLNYMYLLFYKILNLYQSPQKCPQNLKFPRRKFFHHGTQGIKNTDKSVTSRGPATVFGWLLSVSLPSVRLSRMMSEVVLAG